MQASSRRAATWTSAFVIGIFVALMAICYFACQDVYTTIGYSTEVDRLEQGMVNGFNGLIDSMQGVHRYQRTGSEADRLSAWHGAGVFIDRLAAVRAFASEHHLAATIAAADRVQRTFDAWQASTELPTLRERKHTTRAMLSRGDVLIDLSQSQVEDATSALSDSSEALRQNLRVSLFGAEAIALALLLLLVGHRVLADVQRRREHAETVRILEERADALQRSNAALEEFAYVASHDLQEPLRMVASYTQLLARRYQGKLDADADDFIGYAVDGAKRMQGLIQDILDYSRVNTAGQALVPVDAAAACGEAVTNLHGAIAECKADVRCAPLPQVVGDRRQLVQLFQNLIGNAVKYRSSEPLAVEISSERRGNMLAVTVRDNGIGIAPEYHERIFRMFQRLHGKGEYSGTGIGLAICKRIIERHGGDIWVASPPGGGSAFSFTLPLA